MQPANTQIQSPLINKLSREVRDLIYLELWKVACGGLRQHIVWHGSRADKRHFCRWPCSMPPWSPEDDLQREIKIMRENNVDTTTTQSRRLHSPWLNHWVCGEDIMAKAHADNAVYRRITTAFGPCWFEGSEPYQQGEIQMGSYMPMLLACKSIFSECLESIYRSTTFVFTDLMSYQMFGGFCKMPTSMQKVPAQQPPAFFKHACKLEISLHANFCKSIPCTKVENSGYGPVHDALDFHWLQLDRFDHLVDLKIWVNSRVAFVVEDPSLPAVRSPLLVDLGSEGLRNVLQTLKNAKFVSLSAALHLDVDTVDGSEDGLVENVAPSNVLLWKRGTGDFYHPYIRPGIEPGGFGDGWLLANPRRYVKEDTEIGPEEWVHGCR